MKQISINQKKNKQVSQKTNHLKFMTLKSDYGVAFHKDDKDKVQ